MNWRSGCFDCAQELAQSENKAAAQAGAGEYVGAAEPWQVWAGVAFGGLVLYVVVYCLAHALQRKPTSRRDAQEVDPVWRRIWAAKLRRRLEALAIHLVNFWRLYPWRAAIAVAVFVLSATLVVLPLYVFGWSGSLLSSQSFLIGIVSGALTLLAFINTIELLGIQRSILNDYDPLLTAAIHDLQKINDSQSGKMGGSECDPPIQMLAPTPAIGNLSGTFSLYETFHGLLVREPLVFAMSPVIHMRADFSMWHLRFIQSRKEAILRHLTDGGGGGGANSPEAKIQFRKHFRDRRWMGLAEEAASDSALCDEAMEAINRLNGEMDALLSKGGCTAALVATQLDRLCEYAHRNADMEVLGLLRRFQKRQNIYLWTGMGDAFPACIAMLLAGRAYFATIAPSGELDRNHLMGWVSEDESAIQLVKNMFRGFESIPRLRPRGTPRRIDLDRFLRRPATHLKSKRLVVLNKAVPM